MIDGNGILHPRGCGSASHLGVVSGYPTIGVAKTLLAMDGLEEKSIRTMARETEIIVPGTDCIKNGLRLQFFQVTFLVPCFLP